MAENGVIIFENCSLTTFPKIRKGEIIEEINLTQNKFEYFP